MPADSVRPDPPTRETDAAERYEAALSRVGTYMAECHNTENRDALAEPCPMHPVTVADMWTLYCAHREHGNTRRGIRA